MNDEIIVVCGEPTCPDCGGRLEEMPDGSLQCDTCDYRVEA